MPTLSFVKVTNGWPSIDIGALKHPVTIQWQQTSSPPKFGKTGMVLEWSDFCTAMMAIEPISGKDLIRGGQTTTQLLLSAAMWYQEGILPNMRVITEYGSRYVIQSIENVLEMNVIITLNLLGLGPND